MLFLKVFLQQNSVNKTVRLNPSSCATPSPPNFIFLSTFPTVIFSYILSLFFYFPIYFPYCFIFLSTFPIVLFSYILSLLLYFPIYFLYCYIFFWLLLRYPDCPERMLYNNNKAQLCRKMDYCFVSVFIFGAQRTGHTHTHT